MNAILLGGVETEASQKVRARPADGQRSAGNGPAGRHGNRRPDQPRGTGSPVPARNIPA